ncbi:hypothetical protein LCGC14_2868080 [marine sediment metagenome]|uniref:Uncharacterized protein n=1 Tax=marine sediment metagenome TaxID=412755 RepID=A0A0F8Y3K6_9ZZZZ
MSDPKTGLWSAFGALLGGAMGVAAGHYAAKARPRYAGGTVTGESVEDAMVIGGATGAVVGAFIGGAVAGPEPPQLPR